MDYQSMVFGVAGGLGLFLYGMIQMSDGLKKTAGKKLRGILESMTRRRIVGCLVGAGITALIQSSSAATVMVVGFVNAGLLTLKQSIPVIIGTNVGTTATAWLVSISGFEFEITSYALPAIAVGFGMQMFGRSRMVKSTGEILFGFGVLFIGIDFMKSGFDGLESSAAAQEILVRCASNPLLALLAGTALTMLIQSSSAAVASIQLLAMSGAFGSNWESALSVSIPFILGSNIGTTITAQLAALRGNLNARRAAWAHTLFNVIGALICIGFVGLIGKLVLAVVPWEPSQKTIAASIAMAHTGIKMFEAVFFLPLTGILETLVLKIVREKTGDVLVAPMMLEKSLLATPELAIEQVRLEIARMAKVGKRAVRRSIEGLIENDRKKLHVARTAEDVTDTLQYDITSYLTALTEKELSEEMSDELPVLLHSINDLERIGDHAVNIVEIAERKIDQNIVFGDEAMAEVGQLKAEVEQMCDRIVAALESRDLEAASSAMINENMLNQMQVTMRRSHVQRMTESKCSPEAGLIFIDLVDNVEKIGDHLSNIAQSVIGGLQWDGVDVKPNARPVPGGRPAPKPRPHGQT